MCVWKRKFSIFHLVCNYTVVTLRGVLCVWLEGGLSLRARWKPAEESKVRMNKLRHRPRYETYFKVRTV
jgi:hypothetical protein